MPGIKDIAKLAGVSIGTVDRVIHNRGRCAEETRGKVLDAVKKLGYKPNLSARLLKLNQSIRIAVLHALPQQDQGFWESADEGVCQAQQEFKPFNVEIELIPFDRYDSGSFSKACSKIKQQDFRGILLAPLLPQASREFLDSTENIPVVTFDCPLDHKQVIQAFFQDGNCAGETAADLFKIKLPEDAPAAVIAYESENPTIHQRAESFRHAMNNGKRPTTDLFMIPDEYNLTQLRNHLSEHKIDLTRYAGLFIAKTGVSKYAALLNAESKDIFIGGLDLVSDNLTGLKNGIIDFLISQNSTRQVTEGLRTLINTILYQKPPSSDIVKMPVDLLTPSNIDTYLLYHEKRISPC